MAKGSGIGALLTGIAVGAAALFLSDEKNRTKAKAKLDEASAQIKEISAEWQKDPEAVIAELKQKASDIASDLEKSSKDAGSTLSVASREKMLDALAETEKMIKSARASLSADLKAKKSK